jgi:hypothetical protein
VYAHVIRYEVGHADNAEPFVAAVRAQFDALQGQLERLLGSFLITRDAEGEAIALLFWETPEDAIALQDVLAAHPAPETGAREILMGRRPVEDATPVWDVWQGVQRWKTD